MLEFVKKVFAPKKQQKKYEMNCTHTADEMIFSWAKGAVKLVVNKKNDHTFKYVNGIQEAYWKSLTSNGLIREQIKCEIFANKMF